MLLLLLVLRGFRGGVGGGLGHDRMRADDDTKAAAPGAGVVVFRGQRCDLRCQLLGEGRNAAGDAKPISQSIVNVARRCSTARARSSERRDVADQPGRGREQERAREAIAGLVRIVRQRAEQRRVDDEGARRHLEQAFDAAAARPFLDDFKKALPFELAQVVVQRLPRQSETRREAGRRLRLVHLAEDAHAQRRERGGELAGVVEDLHGRDYQLDKFICQISGGGHSR